MDLLLVVGIALVIGLVAAVFAVRRFVVRARLEANQEVRRRLGGNPVLLDDEAEALGVESREQGYLRGLGCLGLGARELVFIQWKPREEITIERSDIVEVLNTTEHRGRDFGRPILAVRFRSSESSREDGTDVIAWKVYDVDSWRRELGGE